MSWVGLLIAQNSPGLVEFPFSHKTWQKNNFEWELIFDETDDYYDDEPDYNDWEEERFRVVKPYERSTCNITSRRIFSLLFCLRTGRRI